MNDVKYSFLSRHDHPQCFPLYAIYDNLNRSTETGNRHKDEIRAADGSGSTLKSSCPREWMASQRLAGGEWMDG